MKVLGKSSTIAGNILLTCVLLGGLICCCGAQGTHWHCIHVICPTGYFHDGYIPRSRGILKCDKPCDLINGFTHHLDMFIRCVRVFAYFAVSSTKLIQVDILRFRNLVLILF